MERTDGQVGAGHAVARRVDRTVPVAERLRCVAGRRSRHRSVAGSTARLRREGNAGSGSPHLLAPAERRIRGGRPRWLDDGRRRSGRSRAHRHSSPNWRPTPCATRSARSCWRSPSPAFPTCTRAPSCSTTASSIPTTAGRWTMRDGGKRSRPGTTRRCASSPPLCVCAERDPTPSCPAATRQCSPQGAAAEHLVAFLRGDDVLVAVSRHTVRLGETGWGDTFLTLPTEQWTGSHHRSPVSAAELNVSELLNETAGRAAGADG